MPLGIVALRPADGDQTRHSFNWRGDHTYANVGLAALSRGRTRWR